MIVDEISILTTVFMKQDSQKIIYPNSVLAAKSIGNYSRSPAMGDEINFSINIYTPWDKIEKLKKEIEKYAHKLQNLHSFLLATCFAPQSKKRPQGTICNLQQGQLASVEGPFMDN